MYIIVAEIVVPSTTAEDVKPIFGWVDPKKESHLSVCSIKKKDGKYRSLARFIDFNS